MGKVLDFEYYDEDRLCTSVHADYAKGEVSVVNYTDDVIEQAFGKQKVTVELLDWFFRERIFDETRVDKNKLLEAMGLTVFDPENIARITHGVLVHDTNWVRFDNENLTWKDIQNFRKQIYYGD